MRVFVAGASGAIGKRLVPQLLQRRHEVVGTVHSEAKAERLRAMGATPIVLDLLDAGAVRQAVEASRPDAIIHQATALADARNLRNPDRIFAVTNELRTRGTDALLAAARATGVRRFIAQSYTGWPYARQGGPIKTEDDPLDTRPPATMRETLAAIRHVERAVVEAGGLALRYGSFYGAPDDGMLEPVRRRRFPIIGRGSGIWSFVHLDDAAAAAVLALERGAPGVYNVVDDEPAPVREWLPRLASALGAPPPRHIPRWLGRLLAGEAVVILMTESRGASNARAKRELGWTLRHPSWRDGFVASYDRAAADVAGARASRSRSRPLQPARP